MENYDISGADGLDLHHFSRAMAWLGEEMEEKPAGALAPRCVKDVIEEKLFDRRHDLFTDLSAVFMDTTSLSFYGEGGQTLGDRGCSKDYRSDLNQMILGLIVDGEGRPICTEMWPGNTADTTTLLPVVDRLRACFGVGRVCVVADRGMISAPTVAGLAERKLEYILGARERTDAIVKRIVLANDDSFVPLLIEPKTGETQLFVKQVRVDGKRYIVCRNEAETEKDRGDREAIVAALDMQLKKGDKALVGNSAYRRYLRKSKEPEGRQVFQIDAGKLAEEARFDGIFVLRAKAEITPLQAVLRYRDLLKVENLFLRTKGGDAHAADLPFLRRRHSRPCLLLLSGADDAEASRRSHGRGWRRPRMETAVARPRSTSASPNPSPRRRLVSAHRRRAVDLQLVPARPHRAAATRTANQPARSGRRAQTSQKTPRPPKAWCHVDLNIAKRLNNSLTCENEVFKRGLAAR
jgi:hypothetical protein